MKFSLCSQVRIACHLSGLEKPEVFLLPVNIYERLVFLRGLVIVHSKKSCRIVLHWAVHIFLIQPPRSVAKILKSVVCANAVQMINQLIRPFTSYIEPSQPVAAVKTPVNSYRQIPKRINSTSTGSSFYLPAIHPSNKGAIVGVVNEEFTQARSCKIGLSHDAVLSLIGQRPRAHLTAPGLRYFIANISHKTKAIGDSNGYAKRLALFQAAQDVFA